MPSNTINDERVLVAFADKMIDDKGNAKNLSQEERGTLRRGLVKRLKEVTEKAVLAVLPDEKLIELEKVLDEDGSDEELEAIFGSINEEEYAKAVEDAMTEFREAYLVGVAGELDLRTSKAPVPKEDEVILQGPNDRAVLETDEVEMDEVAGREEN